MATIEVPISDDKIMELLREKHGFDPDPRVVRSIEVTRQSPVSNSSISHVVSVQLDFGLELGEIEDLVGY